MTTSKTRALIDAIRAELGPATRVVLTDNRSTLLSQTTRGGARTVRVHQMFLDAPPEVRTALARYLARQDPRAGKLVDAFVQGLDHLLDHVVRPFAADAHKGAVHDLLPIYVDVNARYFAHAIRAEIGWGLVGHVAKRSRRTITLGSYDARAERIVIHPALDQPHVPPLCVARIVHHEMLHAKHGEGRDAAGRRIVHGPAFRAEEALFEGALEADRWIAQHLDALLRFGAKRRGPRGDRR
jgi:hypothetical protein